MNIDLLEEIKDTLIMKGALSIYNFHSKIEDIKVTYGEGEKLLYSVCSMERFYLYLLLSEFNCFCSFCDNMKLFRTAYYMSDNIFSQCSKFQADFDVRVLFVDYKMCRKYLMSSDEKKLYHSLPAQVKIYRGMSKEENKSGKYGISWTLDNEIARFFTNYPRNNVKNGVIVEKDISKKDIIACFNERQEKEIIYLYKD